VSNYSKEKEIEKSLADKPQEQKLAYLKEIILFCELKSSFLRDKSFLLSPLIENLLLQILTQNKLWMINPLRKLFNDEDLKKDLDLFFTGIHFSKKIYTKEGLDQFILEMSTLYPKDKIADDSFNRMKKILFHL